jgi:hypothetical protein
MLCTLIIYMYMYKFIACMLPVEEYKCILYTVTSVIFATLMFILEDMAHQGLGMVCEFLKMSVLLKNAPMFHS